jgi:hypothetical protein
MLVILLDPQDQLELLVLLVILAQLAPQEVKVPQEVRDLQEVKVLRDPLDHKAFKAILVPLGLQV